MALTAIWALTVGGRNLTPLLFRSPMQSIGRAAARSSCRCVYSRSCVRLKFSCNSAIFQADILMPGYLSVFKGAYLVSTRVLKPKGHAEAQTTSLIHLQTSIVDEEYNYALAA